MTRNRDVIARSRVTSLLHLAEVEVCRACCFLVVVVVVEALAIVNQR